VLGLERQVGSVAVGKRADLVVLSGNPLTTPIDELGEIEAVMTLVGGEVIWAAEG
jgi:predicted amidohydrolase YtcJ